MPAFILMGVSGSGKSTIGRSVAQSLGLPFIEGDEFHPAANVAKMGGGTPLEDADRMAWIDALMEAVNACDNRDVIAACSALTHPVRNKIRALSKREVVFLHLQAPAALVESRLRTRPKHFMKPGMLPSQLAALQPSAEAIPIDTTRSFEEVCTAVRAQIAARLAR